MINKWSGGLNEEHVFEDRTDVNLKLDVFKSLMVIFGLFI